MTQLYQKYTNEHSRFIPINGNLIHYREEGEGFPLVLLHGAFSSLHTYDGWTQELKKHFRVIRFDLPGFGLTGPLASHDYSLQNHLRYLDLLLNRLKVGKCYIAGSSLGGWLTWEYTLRYPERIEKMILLDAAGFIEEKSIPLPFKMARTPLVNKTLKYVVHKTVLEQFVKQVYFDQNKVTPALVDRYYDLFTREGNTTAFIKLVNRPFLDNTAKLKHIKTPSLILWGEEDKWIPVEFAYRFYDALSNVKAIVYAETGHLPMEEHPKATATDALDFLLD